MNKVNNMNVKELRLKLNLSQGQFAKMVGVSIRTIANWEAGKVIPAPKVEMLRDLESGVFPSQIVTQTRKNAQNVQGNGNHLNADIAALSEKFLALLEEKDRQISRLITIIENQTK